MRTAMTVTCWESFAHDASFAEIMRWCLKHHAVDHLLLVLRRQQIGNKWRYADEKAGERFHSTFNPYVVTGFATQEWPGTKASEPAFVYVLNFNDEVRELVLQTEPSLEKWLHSGHSLPEDPCLFRASDSHPILVTSIHHDVAWLISDKNPDLKGFKPAAYPPSSLFPEGKYFCRKYKKTRR
jgi:hypothetical protein